MQEDIYPKRAAGDAVKAEKNKKEPGRTATIILICVAALLAVAFGALLAVNNSQSDGVQLAKTAPEVAEQAAAIDNAYVLMSSKIKVLLDAGHGGGDPGALSLDETVHEADLNLVVAELVKSELELRGHTVEMTRESDAALAATKDEDMEARRKMIYESSADIVLSIHMNSLPSDTSVAGPIVFCYPEAQTSRLLSSCILDAMNKELEPKREKEVKQDDLLVLRAGNAPAALIECGFMSNAEELEKLNAPDYQQRIAVSIANGVEDFINKVLHEEVPQ